MKRKGNLVLAVVFYVAAVLPMILAINYQHVVDENNALFGLNRPIPANAYNYMKEFNSSMETTIPLLIGISSFLTCVGLCLTVCSKSSVVILACLLLLLTLFPTVTAEEPQRWYVTLFLMEPLDATCISGYIYVYDNHITPAENSFVCFSLGLQRVDPTWGFVEWLECGYFENATGFWLYGASRIIGEGEYGYVEWDVSPFDGEGSNGEWYYPFEIVQKSGNTFQAIMRDPFVGIWLLKQCTFTIQSAQNFFGACGESSDPQNTMHGHFSQLIYANSSTRSSWVNVESVVDDPYTITMGSTNEFYSCYEEPHNDDSGYSNVNMPSCCGGGGSMPKPW